MLAAILATPVTAQQAARPQQDLGRSERHFESLEQEQRRIKSAHVPLPQVGIAPVKDDRRPLFRLTGVVVEGASHVPRGPITATYRRYLGKTVSQADLATIAGRISDLYRAEGFHLTRAIVPPQDIEDGRIHIKVIEGRVADIIIKGERTDQFGIRRLLDVVAAEKPARHATLERQLLLVNDLPGVRITDTAIDEIKTGSGRFRLTVYVQTWTVYTAFSLDSRGTSAVGPWETFLTSSYNSAFVGGDTFGVNLSTIPDTPQELAFGRVFYNMPVGLDGARIGVIAAVGVVRPGDIRAQVDTRDLSQAYEIRGSVVPIRTREQSLWLTGAADVGEFYENTIFGPNYRDHLRTVSLTADYQLHDRFDGWNYWTVMARQGLGIFGASQKDDPLLSRFDGSGEFSKLDIFYTRYQRITDAWSIKASFVGQLVSNPLLASEEFYLASAFGRGFFGAEVSGDNGVGGSLELRFDQALKYGFLTGYQLYAYIDRTVAWNFHSDGAQLVLTLAGAGIRFYLPDDFQFGMEIAQPLDYETPEPQPLHPRGFFYVSKVFRFCPGSTQMRCS